LTKFGEEWKDFVREHQEHWLWRLFLFFSYSIGFLAFLFDFATFYSVRETYLNWTLTGCTLVFLVSCSTYFILSYVPDENSAIEFLADLGELDSKNFNEKNKGQIMADFDALWNKAIYMRVRAGDLIFPMGNILGQFSIQRRLSRISLKIEKLYLNKKDEERYDRIINKLKERFDYSGYFRVAEFLLILIGLFGLSIWKLVPIIWETLVPFIAFSIFYIALINGVWGVLWGLFAS